MKPGKLYIKIFISFIVVLAITEMFIYALFTDSEKKIIGYRMEHNTVIKVMMFKEMLEERIGQSHGLDPAEDEIKDIISHIGKIYEADIWIEDSNATPIQKSFRGDIPSDTLLDTGKNPRKFGDISLSYNIKTSHKVYASVPIKNGEGEILEMNILFKTGKTPGHKRSFALGLAVIGGIIAVLIIPVSRFITERIKQLRQSALRIAGGDLSHRVAVKGWDEIGELARAFNRMTDKLERMIISGKELTANVSHELRTPLTRIRISEEMVREKLAQGNLREYERHLDDIREDIGVLNSLIGRILELSKLDIYESTLKFESIDPTSLLEEFLERFQPVIEAKDLRIKKDFAFRPSIRGDTESLGTAFLNILDNAVKFTPDHGDIIVKSHSEHRLLELSVINSFKDLADKDLTQIFEPFYRAERSNASGSGLGLAITKKIIERHGGNITALNSSEGFEIRMIFSVESNKV